MKDRVYISHAGTILKTYSAGDSDKAVFDQKYLIEEPVYNRHLKQIAKMAGINKSVSNKVARHTNAQLWIRLQVHTSGLMICIACY